MAKHLEPAMIAHYQSTELCFLLEQLRILQNFQTGMALKYCNTKCEQAGNLTQVSGTLKLHIFRRCNFSVQQFTLT